MLNYKNFRQNGFAPIWIILLIFLFGGLFILGRGNLSNLYSSKSGNISKNTQILSVSPSSTPAANLKSIWDFCNSEIKNMPKLPFSYEKIVPTGSVAKAYRKDRIKDKEDLKDYAACGLNYQINNVVEKTYVDVGLQSHVTNSAGSKYWNPKVPVEKFAEAIDNKYGNIVGKMGWARQTKLGGENLSYGLPTLIYYKDMGDKNYYIDVVVAPSSVSLELMVVKK